MDMTWKELESEIRELSDERIRKAAEDMYDWNETGVLLHGDSPIKEIAEKFEVNVETVKYRILKELSERYKKVILLLMKERTSDFLAKV